MTKFHAKYNENKNGNHHDDDNEEKSYILFLCVANIWRICCKFLLLFYYFIIQFFWLVGWLGQSHINVYQNYNDRGNNVAKSCNLNFEFANNNNNTTKLSWNQNKNHSLKSNAATHICELLQNNTPCHSDTQTHTKYEFQFLCAEQCISFEIRGD